MRPVPHYNKEQAEFMLMLKNIGFTLKEIKAEFETKYQQKISVSTIHNYLVRGKK